MIAQPVSTLKTNELYTLNEYILQEVNYISIVFFKDINVTWASVQSILSQAVLHVLFQACVALVDYDNGLCLGGTFLSRMSSGLQTLIMPILLAD